MVSKYGTKKQECSMGNMWTRQRRKERNHNRLILSTSSKGSKDRIMNKNYKRMGGDKK